MRGLPGISSYYKPMPAARGLPASTREVSRLYGRVVSNAAQKVAGSAPRKPTFSRESPRTITSGATEYSDCSSPGSLEIAFRLSGKP